MQVTTKLKYSNNKYSKDYGKPNSRLSFVGQRRGNLLKQFWKTRAIHMKF